MKYNLQHLLSKKYNAYSLQELLVVLVIIGILILISLPNLLPLINRTKSIEAQTQLKHIHTLQESYKMVNATYTTDMNALDYLPQKTAEEGGTARYKMSITQADAQGYIARAESIEDSNGDGKRNIWEITQNGKPKEIQKD